MNQLKTLKEPVTKKSGVKWAPAKLLDTISGLDFNNYTYRWVNRDDANIVKKKAEGWEVASTLKGDAIEHKRPGLLDDGSNMNPSITEYRELLLMKLPNHLAEARKSYYEEMTASTVSGIKDSAVSRARALGGNISGDIHIMR